jgi:hypothetical protein
MKKMAPVVMFVGRASSLHARGACRWKVGPGHGVGLLCFGRGCSSHKIPDVQSPLPVDRGALHLEYKAGESYAEKESPPSFCFLALFFRAAAAHVALLIF